eukprot:Sdes_comp9235_c0_seq1m716
MDEIEDPSVEFCGRQKDVLENLEAMKSHFNHIFTSLGFDYERPNTEVTDTAAVLNNVDRSDHEKTGVAYTIDRLMFHGRQLYNYFSALEAEITDVSVTCLTKEIQLIKEELEMKRDALKDTKLRILKWKQKMDLTSESQTKALMAIEEDILQDTEMLQD